MQQITYIPSFSLFCQLNPREGKEKGDEEQTHTILIFKLFIKQKRYYMQINILVNTLLVLLSIRVVMLKKKSAKFCHQKVSFVVI